MGSPASKFDDEPDQFRPELVTSSPVTAAALAPEQLPLLRMLELVRDRVDSIHAGQRALTSEVREIKANLPMQRRPLSKRAQEIHVRATWSRRNGLCPCCQAEPICTEFGRVGEAEFDHWYSRNQNRVTQTWLVCRDCNRQLNDTDFKASSRSAFEAYQQAIKPFLNRQMAFALAG